MREEGYTFTPFRRPSPPRDIISIAKTLSGALLYRGAVRKFALRESRRTRRWRQDDVSSPMTFSLSLSPLAIAQDRVTTGNVRCCERKDHRDRELTASISGGTFMYKTALTESRRCDLFMFNAGTDACTTHERTAPWIWDNLFYQGHAGFYRSRVNRTLRKQRLSFLAISIFCPKNKMYGGKYLD